MDPTLWCAYERLCSLDPCNFESASKFFAEDHPHMQKLNNFILREFDVQADVNMSQA